MYASAFLTIKKPSPTINLMINNQLQWLEVRTEVKGEKYYFTPEEKSVHDLFSCNSVITDQLS